MIINKYVDIQIQCLKLKKSYQVEKLYLYSVGFNLLLNYGHILAGSLVNLALACEITINMHFKLVGAFAKTLG